MNKEELEKVEQLIEQKNSEELKGRRNVDEIYCR